jgi:hypothetical protein
VLPSSLTRRSPVTSTVSPVCSTRTVATTPRLSPAASNDWNWWPHSTVTVVGSASCSLRCRSPQCTVRKLKPSSLASVRAAFVSCPLLCSAHPCRTTPQSSQLPIGERTRAIGRERRASTARGSVASSNPTPESSGRASS